MVRNLDFNDDSSYRDTTNKERWTTGTGWLPIGGEGNSFKGILNGNGYTLSNLFIDIKTAKRVGLFGELHTSGTIVGMGLLDVSVRGDDRVGSLVGQNGGAISHSYSSGSVSGNTRVGGLVGRSDRGTITQSYGSGATSGTRWVGGLVGVNRGGISHSYSSGSVSGNTRVGGLVGYSGTVNNVRGITGSYSRGSVSGTGDNVGGLVGLNDAPLSNSYSSGSVSGTGDNVGGLVGNNRQATILNSYSSSSASGSNYVGGLVGFSDFRGMISNSYSSGSASGRSHVGGLVGFITSRNGESIITNSYSIGSASGRSYVGGLVGWNSGAISNSYSIGLASGRDFVGGLVGFEFGATVTNSYWDIETSQLSRSAGGIGKTTAMLQDPIAAIGIYSEWSGADWDFGTVKHYPSIRYIPGLDASNLACGTSSSLKPACGSPLPGQKRIQVLISTATSAYINAMEDDLILLEAAPGYSISDAVQITGSPIAIGTINPSKRWFLVPLDLVAKDAMQTTLRFQVVVSDGTDTQQTTVSVVAAKINNGNAVFRSMVQSGNHLTAPSLSDVDGGVDISSIRYRWQKCLVGEDCSAEASWSDTRGISRSYSVAGVEARRNNRFRVIVSYRDGQGYSTEAISRPIVYFARSDTLAPVFTMDWSQFSGGASAVCDDGDIDNDNDGLIEICHLEDLDAVRYALDGSGYQFDSNLEKRTNGCRSGGCSGYELVRDLDFNDDDSYLSTANRVRWMTRSGWLPIGSEADRFRGIFDGNGYTLSNLMINRPSASYIGLFGYLQGGAIDEIGLLDVAVHGEFWTGSLVGRNHGGTISNSHSSGIVRSGTGSVGGLVGVNRGVIGDSHSRAAVGGGTDAGGLVGWNLGGTISGSYSRGSVRGHFAVGGLVGKNSAGTVSNSYSSGSVSGNIGVGGLIGSSNYSVRNSYSSGAVSGTNVAAGGLVGENNGGTISNSYSNGRVRGRNYVGGLVGLNRGVISNSYSRGATGGASGVGGLVGYNNRGIVSSSYSIGSVSGTASVGGLVGGSEGNSMISNSYWDLTKSGLQKSAGGTSQTTTELQAPTRAADIYRAWSSVVWDFGAAIQYPVIKYTQGTDADNPACGTPQQPPCGSLLPEQRTRQIAISTRTMVRADVVEGETVVLNAAIGNWTYQWVQTDGISLTLSTVDTAELRFVVPPDLVDKEATTEMLTLQLTVSTGTAMSTKHTVRLIAIKVDNGLSLVSQPQIIRSKNKLTAGLGLISDPDGAGAAPIYRWQRCLDSRATDVCNIWTNISTGISYLVPAATEADRFRFQFVYTDGQGYPTTVTSEPFIYRGEILFRLKLFLEGALQ